MDQLSLSIDIVSSNDLKYCSTRSSLADTTGSVWDIEIDLGSAAVYAPNREPKSIWRDGYYLHLPSRNLRRM